MHFKIIIPAYNVDKWIATNIMSIKGQQHSDYEVILVDDISTDKTLQSAYDTVGDDSRFVIKENNEKCYALKNIVEGIKYLSPNDDDIIVLLDGDDWMKDRNVLSKVKEVYESTNCLVTYGSYITYPDGISPWNVSAYPQLVIDNSSYREDPQWRATHLRTFKYGLWKKIKDEDFRDSTGEYYRMTWDMAIMFPLLEMSGRRHEYIQDALYVYNRSNPINDDKVDHQLQLSTEWEIRAKQKYEKDNDDN